MVSQTRKLQSLQLLSWKPKDLYSQISFFGILAVLLDEDDSCTVISI
jgi:hypothetical protein